MFINESIRKQIQSCATASQLKTVATDSGMRTMRDDGITKVRSGITTIEEVERVTMRATGAEAADDPAMNRD